MVELGLRHSGQFWVFFPEQFFGRTDMRVGLFIFLKYFDDLLEVLVFFVDLLETLHIADDGRVGELLLQVVKAVYERFEFMYHARDVLIKRAFRGTKIRILRYITGMSLLLHIESATAACSVALSQGGRILAVRDAEKPNSHGETMTRLIEACFQEVGAEMADLSAVALSAGPGSYTALRVGAATAKGICYALGKPLVRVDTLKAIAWAMREGLDETGLLFFPMIDARRMEVYTAIYNSWLEELAHAQAMVVESGSFDAWMEEGLSLVFAGDGAQKCEPILSGTGKRFMDVSMSAKNMIALGQAAFEAGRFEDAAYFSPLYLKPPNITQSAKKWWAEPG